MNGAQDMGGVHGFGPVEPEPNEPPFHAEWEKKALALVLAMGPVGGWNIDMSRSARENVPPGDYLSRSYYEIWIGGLERLMAERGLVLPEEVDAGHTLYPPKPVPRTLSAADVAAVLRRGGPWRADRARG